jgi:hypothetical protein
MKQLTTANTELPYALYSQVHYVYMVQYMVLQNFDTDLESIL